MKIVIALLALVVAISAAPTQINDNNVGDIVNVGVKANLDVVNNIDYTRVNVDVLVKILQSLLIQGGDRNGGGILPANISPEMIQQFMQAMQK
jgi:hypothetical protein